VLRTRDDNQRRTLSGETAGESYYPQREALGREHETARESLGGESRSARNSPRSGVRFGELSETKDRDGRVIIAILTMAETPLDIVGSVT
jgi:hypothetical protein